MKDKNNLESGLVIEVLPASTFKVELPNGKVVRAHLSDRMKLNHITVMLQDKVLIFISGDIGRIERRL